MQTDIPLQAVHVGILPPELLQGVTCYKHSRRRLPSLGLGTIGWC